MAALRERTYRRIVDPETSTSGISRRIRIRIRCAVCRCFLGALRSDSRIALINGIAGASFGCSRSGTFRSAGIALSSARRTSRRCTPNFRDTARIVPGPCSYSLRICSYSSTLALLFSNPSVLPGANARNKIYGLGVTGGAKSDAQKGPIQSSELMRLLIKDITVEKSAPKQLSVHIRWQGNASTDLTLQLPPNVADRVRYPAVVVDRIRDMAHHLPDAEIADQLRLQGHSSAKGKPYTAKIVQWIRCRYRIPPPALQKPEELTVHQVAKHFEVSEYVVYYWIQR